jgi:Helix-turn-helix domain
MCLTVTLSGARLTLVIGAGQEKSEVSEMTKKNESAATVEEISYVDVPGAMELTHYSEPSVRRLLTQRKLTRYKLGGRTLIDRAELLRLIRKV